MVQHPDVFARAQAELDAVLGVAQRLPTFEDRTSLPYCDAVFTETLRWGVPVPLSKFPIEKLPRHNTTRLG